MPFPGGVPDKLALALGVGLPGRANTVQYSKFWEVLTTARALPDVCFTLVVQRWIGLLLGIIVMHRTAVALIAADGVHASRMLQGAALCR